MEVEELQKLYATGERNFQGITLVGLDLKGITLAEVNLTGSDLSNANFTRANLSNVILTDANLSGVNLREADLGDASLTPPAKKTSPLPIKSPQNHSPRHTSST